MSTEHDTVLTRAHWIWTAGSRPNQWVALHRSFSLAELPTLARVTIAVDTKYWLYVNGHLVIFEGGLKRGSAPTDTYCDEVDLTHVLVTGQNVIAVLVWYFGTSGFSHRDSGAGGLFWDAPFLVSGTAWWAIEHPGYLADTDAIPPNYRLAEANIQHDARRAAVMRVWETTTYDDRWWEPAMGYGPGGSSPWHRLVPRPIPFFHWTGFAPSTNAHDPPQTEDTTPVLAHLPGSLKHIAFTISIEPDHEVEYRQRHQVVWPEMRAALTEAGCHNYSTYTKGLDLFAYMEVESFSCSLAAMETSDANQRWQAFMSDMLETNANPATHFPFVLAEVFHLD